MAFLNQVPVTRGVPATFTLNLAEVLTLATDSYFQQAEHLSSVVLIYTSLAGGAVGKERKMLRFRVPANATGNEVIPAIFRSSAKARSAFELKEVVLFDHDKGAHRIPRSAITSPATYNVAVPWPVATATIIPPSGTTAGGVYSQKLTRTFSLQADQPNATFVYSLNGSAQASTTASLPIQDPGAGTHLLTVWAVNPDGVASPTPAVFQWVIDQSGPVISYRSASYEGASNNPHSGALGWQWIHIRSTEQLSNLVDAYQFVNFTVGYGTEWYAEGSGVENGVTQYYYRVKSVIHTALGGTAANTGYHKHTITATDLAGNSTTLPTFELCKGVCVS